MPKNLLDNWYHRLFIAEQDVFAAACFGRPAMSALKDRGARLEMSTSQTSPPLRMDIPASETAVCTESDHHGEDGMRWQTSVGMGLARASPVGISMEELARADRDEAIWQSYCDDMLTFVLTSHFNAIQICLRKMRALPDYLTCPARRALTWERLAGDGRCTDLDLAGDGEQITLTTSVPGLPGPLGQAA